MSLRPIAVIAGMLLALPAGWASADVFELANQGAVRGQLLNPNELPRAKYVVRTNSGAVITLDRKQVRNIDHETPVELEYEKLLPTYPDTVEGQWELAEWCRENKFNTVREKHLARVIQLAPDHELARRALGFIEFDGQWKTQDQVQEERGFVKYKGSWRLPQEIEVLERKSKDRSAEARWYKTLRQWRGWLGTERAAEAQAKLRSINDPYALKAITEQLQEERNQQIRLWYLESLSKIPAPDALTLLVGVALHDSIEEVRLTALDFIVDKKAPEVPAMFIAALKHRDPAIVNRAAIALGRIKHPAAIGPLIEALVTTRKYQIAQGSPGGVGATFSKGPNGTGGSGLSVGQSVQTVYEPVQNQEVLGSLIKLTGQNFDFNVVAWKSWFANQKKPETLDARRG
jgi:hypothetical protein